MPTSKRPPSYRLHKARNCAVVTINGKNHYLGPYGSPVAQVQPPNGKVELSINGLLLAYWGYAKDH